MLRSSGQSRACRRQPREFLAQAVVREHPGDYQRPVVVGRKLLNRVSFQPARVFSQKMAAMTASRPSPVALR